MKATKSKGSEVPEYLNASLSLNFTVVFCMSPWKCLRGFLVPFALSLDCHLFSQHPCFCSFAVNKMNSLVFLLYRKKTTTKRKEKGIEKGFSESCTYRGESLVNTDTHSLVGLSASICQI